MSAPPSTEPAIRIGPAPVRHLAPPPRRIWRTWLVGRPLSTEDAPHQAIGKTVGLAVFASDALSSTAYATQEILAILILAGTAALSLVLPISVAIVVLLVVVTISYQQTIHTHNPDVPLLDLGLPDGDGVEVTRRLREWSASPIVVISARGQEVDKVEALDAGRTTT